MRKELICAIMGCLLWAHPGDIQAGEGCCAQCGCQAQCNKVCRLVCEEQKVTVTCWGCKQEDFCLPGHNKRACEHSEVVCDECGDTAGASSVFTKPKNFVWADWIPGCATFHTKTKLMKKTVTKKVPGFKWVVEDLCATCQSKQSPAAK